MNKKLSFGIAAALLSCAASAQTFPVQNLQVNGNAALGANVSITGGTVTGVSAPMKVNGTVSSAITTDSTAVTGSGNAATTAPNLYEAAVGPGTGTANAYDAVRGVAISPAGSSVLTTTGVAGYVQNDTVQGANGFSGAVGLFGVAISDADHSSSWGIDTICTDHMDQVASSGVSRACFDEFDFNMNSTGSTAGGLIIGGTWQAQPASATGVTVFKPNGTGKWQYAFGTQAGAATDFAYIGLSAASGNSVSSQAILFNYTDAGGTTHSPVLLATPNGLQTTASAVIPGSANTSTLGTSSLYWQQTYTEIVDLVPYTVSALPTCNASLKNALASVTDAASPTWNGTLTGGGSTSVMAFCNGTNWTAH